MPNSPKMQWPYAAKDQNPWYDTFSQMVTAMDSSGYASREDRNILITDGGTISFTASTGVLNWSNAINILSPISGFKISINIGSVTLTDGQALFINIPRAPTNGTTLSLTTPLNVNNQVPNSDTAMVIAVRSGSYVYFRNGTRVFDGNPGTLFTTGMASGSKFFVPLKIGARESHNSTTPLVVGGISLNPSDYSNPGFTQTMTFKAVTANGNGVISTSVNLYNLTDAESVATLTFPVGTTSPIQMQTALTIGTGVGNIKTSAKIYEVRIYLGTAYVDPTYTVELYGAEILITNTSS